MPVRLTGILGIFIRLTRKATPVDISECTVGDAVTINHELALLGLQGAHGIITGTRPPPEQPWQNPAYPRGMVQVRLAPGVSWPVDEPWFDPAHLDAREAGS